MSQLTSFMMSLPECASIRYSFLFLTKLKEKRSPASGIDREYLLKIVQVINLYYIYVRKSAILIADTN
jgi:hypothetical protein